MQKQESTNKEKITRDSFVFYRSYFEVIQTLSKKNRLLAYEAIVRYSLNQEVMEELPLQVQVILKMAMPNIDANNRKYINRIKSKEQRNAPDFEKELNEKVRLPKRESGDMADYSFLENEISDFNVE